MLREIIKIDEEKCDGCGLCVPSCVEGALKIVNGKAKLVADVYCDGLGACLGECPQGALTIERREADEFDEEAAKALGSSHKPTTHDAAPHAAMPSQAAAPAGGCCPGSAIRNLAASVSNGNDVTSGAPAVPRLGHWPVQLMLVSPSSPFLKNADLVVCADCVPFAVPDFHDRYLAGRAVVVGCPKLDNLQHYREKLTEMIRVATPQSVTVLRMEVPCCGGLAGAVVEARDLAMPDLPVSVHQIGIKGDISTVCY
jgi:Pyruvate/2-oxoacid:ferredoxin oxidoreductase delta subunit